jgi:hypothetical protein
VAGDLDQVVGIHSGSVDGDEDSIVSVSLPPGWSYFTGDAAEEGGPQVRNAVVSFYDSGLLRPPDGSGLIYWSSRVGDAASCVPELRTANRSFLTNSEFRAGAGVGLVNGGRRIRRLFWTALNRNPSPSDEEFFLASLASRMDNGQTYEQAWASIVSQVTATAEGTTRYTRACQLQ